MISHVTVATVFTTCSATSEETAAPRQKKKNPTMLGELFIFIRGINEQSELTEELLSLRLEVWLKYVSKGNKGFNLSLRPLKYFLFLSMLLY